MSGELFDVQALEHRRAKSAVLILEKPLVNQRRKAAPQWDRTIEFVGSPPFVLMTVSGKALAAGSGRIQNPRLAPCGSLNTRFNTNGGEPVR